MTGEQRHGKRQLRPLKVLSIDWDYFPDATVEQIKHLYPDGVETTGKLNSLIWAIRYGEDKESKESLENIKVNSRLFSCIKSIISKAYKGRLKKYTMICESHKEIHDLICDVMKSKKLERLKVYNIDMHHDMFTNATEELSCGNWVIHLYNKYKGNMELSWFNRDASIRAYGLAKLAKKTRMFTDDISQLEGTEFDIIFLCKSSAWAPPHLDRKFRELVMHIVYENKGELMIQKGIMDSRKYRRLAEAMHKSKKKLLERFIKNGKHLTETGIINECEEE